MGLPEFGANPPLTINLPARRNHFDVRMVMSKERNQKFRERTVLFVMSADLHVGASASDVRFILQNGLTIVKLNER